MPKVSSDDLIEPKITEKLIVHPYPKESKDTKKYLDLLLDKKFLNSYFKNN